MAITRALYYIMMTLSWGYLLLGLVLWDWHITIAAAGCSLMACVLSYRIRRRHRFWTQYGRGLHSHCGGGDGE